MLLSELIEHFRYFYSVVLDKELFGEHYLLVILFESSLNNLVYKFFFLALT